MPHNHPPLQPPHPYILLYTGTVSPALAQNVGIRRKLWSVGTLYIEVIRRYVAARPDLQSQMTVITW